jgi:DNA-binding IclR family transcriptional regulator
MATKPKISSTPRPADAVLKVVSEHPGTTGEHVAKLTGIARSTASKALADHTKSGAISRHLGGREGRKRLPDRYTAKGVKLPAEKDATSTATATKSTTTAAKKTGDAKRNADASKPAPPTAEKADRLKPGELDGLVLKALDEADGPLSATQLAKLLDRSSGAIANCLTRLTAAKQAKQASDKPRKYKSN